MLVVMQRPGLPRRPGKLCAGWFVSRLPGGSAESRRVARVGWDDDEGPVIGPPLPVVGQDSIRLRSAAKMGRRIGVVRQVRMMCFAQLKQISVLCLCTLALTW